MAKSARRAKLRSVVRASSVRVADIVKAHGRRCHICNEMVSLGCKEGPQAATVDHVVPLALGGWHDLINLRITHKICNSIKSDTFSGQLMLTL